jgi:Fe2+ or Zn2+ uptake regulation protein
MNSRLSLLHSVLAEHGYSDTIARRTVFSQLEHHKPQTMKELVEALDGVIDRASIYRTIALFESLHIVQRIHIGWKYKIELSQRFLDHHHHITCLICGKLETLRANDALETLINNLAKKQGYTMSTHQIELQGICKTCTAKQKTSSKT